MKKETLHFDSNNYSEEELRHKAMELHEQRWKVSDICSTLNCSRSWFYKWLNRYKSNSGTWFESESRAPKTSHRKIEDSTEQLILDTRKRLMAARFSQYGPQAIYYALERKGYVPPPVWSIARVLKRHNVTRKKKNSTYIAKGKKYPYVYSLCHQIDFVGPRYLSCKARYYFLNIIDCETHWSQIGVLENETSTLVCKELIRFWKKIGIPDFLQMDNDLAFWGSLRVPGAVGKVIRLCLLLNVTPVFIPQGEPWRNGIIEHFNHTIQDYLLKINFQNIKELREAADHFDEIHNNTHHYSSQKGMTPYQANELYQYPLQALNKSFEVPDAKLQLENGEIHIIRFVRSDLKFNVFGLSFSMPKQAMYEYVKGIILTDEQRLLIYKDQKFLIEFPFNLL